AALRDTFSFSLRLLFFITLPAMAGLIVLSEPIIQVLLQRGEFTAEAASETAYALICYSTGLWAFVGTRIVASTFYSLQDMKTPVKIAALSILTNIVFSLLLMGPLRHGGLALANALGSAVNFSLLFYFLRKRLGKLDGRNIVRSFIRAGAASAAMAAAALLGLRAFGWSEIASRVDRAGVLIAVIAASAALFLALAAVMKSEELGYLISMRKRKGPDTAK
ncbi:MAG: polysaccharide biosynthesis C-terminal domain-containing protein, partial [Nitrospiraceae bacterium]